jgi:hypothetical protein
MSNRCTFVVRFVSASPTYLRLLLKSKLFIVGVCGPLLAWVDMGSFIVHSEGSIDGGKISVFLAQGGVIMTHLTNLDNGLSV